MSVAPDLPAGSTAAPAPGASGAATAAPIRDGEGAALPAALPAAPPTSGLQPDTPQGASPPPGDAGARVSLSEAHGLRLALARRPFAWLLDVAAAALAVATLALAALVFAATRPANTTQMVIAVSAGTPSAATSPGDTVPAVAPQASPAAPPPPAGPSWRPEATVFVTYGSPPTETRALEAKLAALDGVALVRFVSREEAFTALARADMASAGVLSTLKTNPLPDAYVVRFEAAALPERVEAAVAAARRLPRVDAVDFDLPGWRRAHHGEIVLRGAATLVGLAALALLLTLALRLAGAALPLDPTRVRVLRLVGASRRQIRRPVVLLGALGFGAAAAGGCALALIVASVAAPRLGALAPLLAVPWSWPLPAALLAGGIAAGVLAAAAGGAALATVGARRAERRIDGP